MKITGTKPIYESRYFKVVQNTIERNGKTFTKDFIERNSTVVIIAYTKENEIYMESQFRDALGKTSIEVVAGQIEQGDESLYSAKKELKEESGLVAATWHKIAEWDLSVNMKSKVHVYAATDLTQEEQALEEDEEIEIIKMPLDEVIKKVENGEITGTSHVASLLLFKKLREEGKL